MTGAPGADENSRAACKALHLQTMLTRDKLGLARPAVIQQLVLNLGWPKELAEKMKAGQAGVLIGRRVRYSGK